jgi:fatty acid desaturase
MKRDDAVCLAGATATGPTGAPVLETGTADARGTLEPFGLLDRRPAPDTDAQPQVHDISVTRCDTRERVRAIRAAIYTEERRLRARYPWLVHQDVLGLVCFSVCLSAAVAMGGAYLTGGLRWWLAVPLIALPLSILHEIEHDLIHDLYFRRRRWVQNVMFTVIWFCKLGLNPWYRRRIHLKHHRESGQTTDIEERLIGIGLPLGWLRLFIALHPLGSVAVFLRLLRDAPDFRPGRMVVLSLPTYLIFAVLSLVLPAYLCFGSYSVLPASGWPPVRDLTVLLFAPNVLRQVCLILMSSYSHYYADIPPGDVYYQNQVLTSRLLWPLQAFCCNFGGTHIIHHYVVRQPFYVRQLVAAAAHAEMIRQGVRHNDFGTVARNNRAGLGAVANRGRW